MSVTASSMKCPACPGYTLDTLSAAIGVFERCPNCSGLFIHQDLVCATSQDRIQCREALEETKGLLLPTEWWCPKCLQKLYDGRARSRGVIFTLCPACQSLWTGLPALRQFEETVEKTLRLQIEIATNSSAAESSALKGPTSGAPAKLYADSGLGSFFRSFARLFDRWADRFSRAPGQLADGEQYGLPLRPQGVGAPTPAGDDAEGRLRAARRGASGAAPRALASLCPHPHPLPPPAGDLRFRNLL